MSRHGPDSERIAVARLCGTATHHARDSERDERAAVDELIRIATEHVCGVGPRLRRDLLTEAAGSELGGYRYSATAYWWGEVSSRLLVAAGADPDLVQDQATVTAEKLRTSTAPGIGNRRGYDQV